MEEQEVDKIKKWWKNIFKKNLMAASDSILQEQTETESSFCFSVALICDSFAIFYNQNQITICEHAFT